MSEMIERYHQTSAVVHMMLRFDSEKEIIFHESLLFTQIMLYNDGCIVLGNNEFIIHKSTLSKAKIVTNNSLSSKLVLELQNIKLTLECLDKRAFRILNCWIKE